MKRALVVIVLVSGLASLASASVLAFGSVSFTDTIVSYTGVNLASATSVTAMPAGIITSTFGDFVGLTPIPSATVINPFTFNIPLGTYPLFISWGDGTNNTRFTFSVVTTSVGHVSTNDLEVAADGIFQDSLGTYTTSGGSVILSLTQTGGPGGAISMSGTFATPPEFTLVPEPGYMLLIGGALVALGVLRRKKP